MPVDTLQRPVRTGDIRGGWWLNVAAIVTWLVCGLPPLVQVAEESAPWWPRVIFLTAFLLYGAALVAVLYLRERKEPGLPERLNAVPPGLPERLNAVPPGLPERLNAVPPGVRLPAVMLLVVESVTGLILIYVSGHYLGGTAATSATLVIVAAQAPYIVRASAAWLIVALQTLVISLMFWPEAGVAEILSLALAIGGFQAFASASSFLALSEAAARAQRAEATAELQAAQGMLAESSRTEERLRISRDLHDTLGHHLTALSLQLDVASRVSEGKAADHVRQAHAITRLLLSDVRDVVGTLRDTRPLDLAREIRALAEAPSTIAIHLEAPSALEVADRDRAQALLRCVQEIITNAARHAHARNLWIRIEARADGVTLHARDDGQGVPQVALGHGLTGMRERFAALAGSVEFESRPDTGFEVRGFMPTPHAAS